MMCSLYSARFTSAIVAVLLFHAGEALANGTMWDTPQRGAGNILAPSSRFAVQKESLDVRAEATDYAATVVYTLTDQAAQQPGKAATMHFPVICSHFEDEEVPASKSCVHKIEFLVNDKPFRARFVPAREVSRNHTLTVLATTISERARHAIHSKAEDFASEYQFYRLDIPADLVVRTLAVRYRAAYNQTAGATSKNAGTGYGPASLIYDFSPASRWAGADTATLDIRIDTSRMRSSPDWNARLWPFVREGDVLTLSLARPDFAKLPPLLMQTSNGNYQNHAAFVEDLQQSTLPDQRDQGCAESQWPRRDCGSDRRQSRHVLVLARATRHAATDAGYRSDHPAPACGKRTGTHVSCRPLRIGYAGRRGGNACRV
jgi:hypothetical protein